MQIERRFVRDGKMAQQVHDGIVATAPLAERLGSDHPDVLTALGKLYADTVSNLRPKVMVQGNPHYLGQADIVSEIRALLLAALRSAVLWRQMGGSLFDFLLGRRSEEHTSELKTLMRISYAVFCLKKNTQQTDKITSTNNP